MIRAMIGYGGHARDVIAWTGQDLPAFVDDEFYSPSQKNTMPLSSFDPLKYEVIVAIGDSSARSRVVGKLPKETKYFTVIHQSVIMGPNIEIGAGSILCPGVIVAGGTIKLGTHALLNLSATIGHDCQIGNFFTASPGANISGSCKIGDRVYIGANSSCLEKITIFDDVLIGLQSSVIRNIYESGTYVGSPVRKIK